MVTMAITNGIWHMMRFYLHVDHSATFTVGLLLVAFCQHTLCYVCMHVQYNNISDTFVVINAILRGLSVLSLPTSVLYMCFT